MGKTKRRGPATMALNMKDSTLPERVFTCDVIELIGAHVHVWDYRALHRLQQVARGWRDVFRPQLQTLPARLDCRIDELKSSSRLQSYREQMATLLHSMRPRDFAEVLSLGRPPAGVCEVFHLAAVLIRSAFHDIPRPGD